MSSLTLNSIYLISIIFIVSITATHSKSVADVPGLTKHCLTAPPIENNYTATGTFFKINNMTVYETLNKTSKRILINVYDIFGFHSNTKQFADKIAKGFGFRVAMPDYFHGPPWDENKFPPEKFQDLLDWVAVVGNWTVTAKTDTLALINHYRTTENITEFAMYGFCWGGYIVRNAASEIPEIKAAGLLHPSLVFNEEAEAVQTPMYLLPSKEEPDMLPFYDVLQKKFGTNCGHRRFDDMHHGFSSARGNFSDPLNKQRVDEAIEILGNFFSKNLNANSIDP